MSNSSLDMTPVSAVWTACWESHKWAVLSSRFKYVRLNWLSPCHLPITWMGTGRLQPLSPSCSPLASTGCCLPLPSLSLSASMRSFIIFRLYDLGVPCVFFPVFLHCHLSSPLPPKLYFFFKFYWSIVDLQNCISKRGSPCIPRLT